MKVCYNVYKRYVIWQLLEPAFGVEVSIKAEIAKESKWTWALLVLIFVGMPLAAIVWAVTEYNGITSASVYRTLDGYGYTDVIILDRQPTYGLGAWQGCTMDADAKFTVQANNNDGEQAIIGVCVSGSGAATLQF